MTATLATIVVIFGIGGLFLLEKDREYSPSWPLWLPTIWLLIAGSRHVSEWLNGISDVPTTQQYMEGSPLDARIYAILIAAAITVLVARRKTVANILRKNWFIVFFVLYCLASVLWSDFPGVALKRWIKSLGDYTMILILLTEVDRLRAIRTVLARVAFVLLPLSILFIKYYPSLGRAYALHWDSSQFLIGVCDNKNMLGLICLIFGLAAISQLLEAVDRPRKERRRIMLVSAAVTLMALYLVVRANSMTSLACLVLASSVLVAHRFFPVVRRPVILHSMIAGMIVCAIAVLFLGAGHGALHDLGRNSTLTGRTAIWSILKTVPVNPVVGTGFDSFWLGKRLDYLWSFPILNGITEAHNGYFEMYLNLGLVGDLFIAAFLWIGYRRVTRDLEIDPARARLRLGYFLVAVIYNFTEAGFRNGDLIWFTFILAIMMPSARLRKSTAKRHQQQPAWWRDETMVVRA